MASSPSLSPALRDANSATPTPKRPNRFLVLADSSSEDDSEILRPRGKMAARMQARSNAQQESESESEAEDVALPTRDNRASLAPGQVDNTEDADNDDDVVTTRPRKLQSRRERSSTPESRPQEAPSSPGLFVSPSKPQSPSANNVQSDDDDLPSPGSLTKNPRFHALVAKKRKERLAGEAEEARKKAERRQFVEDDDDDDNITDDEGGRKLTQEVAAKRAPRKASKKALEDMHRETQRLSRSLQLAHEAKVKKKITKASLFERFNFKPEGSELPVVIEAPATSSRPATPGSAQQSDAEMKDVETPPSSPPAVGKDGKSNEVTSSPAMAETLEDGNNEDMEDFPTLEEIVERKRLDKGKGKATAADLEQKAAQQPMAAPPRPKRNLRVKLPSLQAHTAAVPLTLDDDDDDLQIQPARKTKVDAIFDRIPLNQAKQPRALQLLRKLAQLDDPDKKGAAPVPARCGKRAPQNQQQQQAVMTVGELQASLLQRARLQAKVERDRQLEMLRAKGVHVQTAEEREKEMQDVEDIVARARQEAEEIMDREREVAKAEKKARRKAGEEDPLGWDDSEDDEDYLEVEEEEAAEIELSGSDEEGGEEDEGEEEDAAEGIVDDAAEDAEESETEEVEEQPVNEEDEEEELPSSKQVRRRARKQVTILSDDEADDAEPLVKATPRPKAHLAKSPSVRNPESPNMPTSVLRSATKTFIPGLPVAGPAGLGLTQIFAGTMDDSQMGTAMSPSQPRPTFDAAAFPDSNFSQTAREMEDMILNSQPAGETQDAETQGVQLRFSQSQMHGFDSFLEDQLATQASDFIEPTQDSGFQNFSPLARRFVEPPVSTIATVQTGQTQADAEQNESPLVRRTGKLRRRADVVPASPSRRQASDAEDEDEPMEDIDADEFGFGTTSNNAFAAMKEAVAKEKKRKEAFDKKKSKAREMVQEQADESEDEYAGLGGADGEDDSDDDDHSVHEMIDDETKDKASDERKLAAFYADRERASDEKQVEKLFHDITTGMLRRKRTGNWDELSDSDDGGEARRRMKRRQFAKMQRALFTDERISKVAENPRNQAFLRTIEDHGSDDDMDFIFAPPPAPAGLESQDSQLSTSGDRGQATTTIPDSQPQSASAVASRPIANPRRTKDGKRPSNIGEIRESLSNLLDEPSSIIPATDPHSSDDDDDGDEENTRPQSSHSNSDSTSSNKENRNPRRRSAPSTAIIDRINLKRNSSSSSSTGPQAFTTTTTSTNSNGPKKVPALLRRATTNSFLSTSSSTSTTSATGVTTTNTNNKSASDSLKIKKPAGKRSGVSYLARETERRAAVAESERRREARKFRGMEGRGKAVGGLFGGGRFE